jgi:MFS family permease
VASTRPISAPPPAAPGATPSPGPAGAPAAATRTGWGIDWLNFFLADVQTGLGPFVAIYLAGRQWNPQSIGIALTVGGIAGIVAQAPAGALVDALRAKRTLIAVGVVFLAIGAMMIAFLPRLWPILAAQTLIGVASSVFVPAVAAITLGVVGPRLFDRRQGRNQTFNSAGNVVAAIAMGVIGYKISNRAIFFFVATMTLPTLASIALINADDIDYDRARGGGDKDKRGESKFTVLLRDRRLAIFLACCVLFHFANAAMLPLLGELLSKGKGKASMAFMSVCVVTTQLVVALIAAACGALASRWGRKPVMMAAFLALPIRGLLIAIQILDGVGAGVFGVVSVLIIADLTRGTGRFNLAQGAIGAAVGIGASLSQSVAGGVVRHFGFDAGFLFLAVVAGAAALMFGLLMPETLSHGDDPHDAPRSGT